MMNQTRVIMIIENQFARRAIRSFLEAEPSVAVIGEASPDLVDFQLITSLQPDVILIDLACPCGPLAKTIAAIKHLAPGAGIIALGIGHHTAKTISAVADSVLLRSANEIALLQAIDEVR